MSLFNENFYTDDFDQEMIDYVCNLGSISNRTGIDTDIQTKYKYLKYASSCDYFWTNDNSIYGSFNYLTKEQFKEKIGMTQKQFTKADLKTGMIIELMNGEIAQVLLNTPNGDIVAGDTWFPLLSYTDEDLFGSSDMDHVRIKAVYLPKNNRAFSLAKLDNLSQYNYEVVWKRAEKSAEQIEIESIQAEMDKLSQRLSELKEKV